MTDTQSTMTDSMTQVDRGFFTHDFQGDLEVRDGASGRTIYGLAVPFGVQTRASDNVTGRPFIESFAPGSFTRTLSHAAQNDYRQVKLLSSHNLMNRSAPPLGRALRLWEDKLGVMGEWLITQTRAGEEALTMVRDGTMDALSVGFLGMSPAEFLRGLRDPSNSWTGKETVEWTEVALREVSLVPFGAYPDAFVMGVRAEELDVSHTDEQSPTELAPGTSDQLDSESPANQAPTGMTRGQRDSWLRTHTLG